MKRIALWFIVIFCLTATGCNEKDCCMLPQESVIRYGTSFGFCIGYCHEQLTITPNSSRYDKTAWNNEDEYPPKECKGNYSQWQQLNDRIDLKAFYDLPATIGCPDCADGGAEWVEIATESKTHRVTFEYNKAPAAMNRYITLLREQFADMAQSCE